MRLLQNFIFFSLILLLACGCTSVVKNLADTQPKVTFQEKAYEKPESIVEGDPFFYEVDLKSSDSLDADLAKYAPVVVQGFQPKQSSEDDYSYSYWADGIGHPLLSEDGNALILETDKPALFSRVEYAEVLGTRLKQLVYVFWYPERPVGTLETGKVDGNILRITLNAAGQPSLFEYSQTCGCFHGIFVASHLESWAMDEFATPLSGKTFVVEKKSEGKTDWLVRDLIDVVPEARPMLFISAGSHFCHAIRFHPMKNKNQYPRYSYRLLAYDRLTDIPKEKGGSGSMFNDEGLVIGGKRWKEEIFLSALDHPGWPRHLDKMLIHWDESRWNDPHLLEEHLRLPKAILETAPTSLSVSSDFLSKKGIGKPKTLVPSEVCSVCDANKPYVLIFTHPFCVACRSFKKDVLPLSQVQKALQGWNCILLNIQDAKNKRLADEYRVDATPTFITFQKTGEEIARASHLDTDAKFIAFLQSSWPSSLPPSTNVTLAASQPEPVKSQPEPVKSQPEPVKSKLDSTFASPSLSFQKFPSPPEDLAKNTKENLVEEIRRAHTNGKSFLLFFTHRMCLGCKEFKDKISHSQEAQTMLKEWNFIELDMFDPQNAKLGELYSIEVTPSIVLFSSDGKILRRNDQLEKVEDLLSFLRQ